MKISLSTFFIDTITPVMEIVTASILDLNALRKLENESFGKDAWPLFDLIAVLTFPEVIRLKAVEDGQMAGFVAGDPRPRDGWGWIATIAVDPRYGDAASGAHCSMPAKPNLACHVPV